MQTDREECIEYLKNIWTVQKFFIGRLGINPLIISWDQMLLHCNGIASQKVNTTEFDTNIYQKKKQQTQVHRNGGSN